MSARNSKDTSRTNWERLSEKTDEEINTADIPPLGEEFFAQAKLREPRGKVTLTVSVDEDVAKWYEAQGAEFRQRMSAALRIYAEAHREAGR